MMYDVLFADPNIADDGVYIPAAGDPVSVRVVLQRPDRSVRLLDAGLMTPSTILQVRVSEIAMPRAGDVFEIAGATYLIKGEPKRDPLRQVWTLELVEQ